MIHARTNSKENGILVLIEGRGDRPRSDKQVRSYNSDDTINSVTDARGVTVTNGYNARHLLTSITYPDPQSLPAGVTPTSNVTYAYDAAGNKTSITDDTGSTSYSYDQLSRPISETRYFNQLNRSYELDYGYNLANDLTSISIPGWSEQINYNHDSANRLTGITASGFINTSYPPPNFSPVSEAITTFASNISYRAWGAVKQMTYGNGVQLAMGYNEREQTTQYQLTNMTFGNDSVTTATNYDYYADGKLRYAGKTDRPNFDRSYTYDHVGRIKDALTGSEARGGTTPDGPYRESFSYDTWNNTVSEARRIWTGSTTSSNYSFANNRRAGWGYDANGFAGSNDDGTLWYDHNYNAAGKRTHFVPNIDNTLEGPAVEMNDTFDGNDLPVKRVDTRRSADWQTGHVTTTNETNYYLHSTALGGQVLAELDAQGNKKTVYIYLNGMQFAQEVYSTYPTPAHSVILWHYTDPVTGSNAWGSIAREYNGMQELDPLGADVTAPPPTPDVGNYGSPDYFTPERETYLLAADAPEFRFPDWYVNMANAKWDAHLAEKLNSIGRKDLAQEILARNPNVGINISGNIAALLAEKTGTHVNPDGSVTLWGATAAAALGVIGDPQNTPCERRLAATFSDDPTARFVDVTDSNGYDPVIQSDRTPRDAAADEHNHLYNAQDTPTNNTNVFAPGGGRVVGSGVSDRQNWMSVYYKNLGGVSNVILQIWHVENYNGRGGTPQGGRILLGQMGENGNIRYGPPGSPEGWHVHINAYQWWGRIDRRGRLIGDKLGARSLKVQHRLRLSDLLCK